MESQDTVDVETAGDRQSDRDAGRKQERKRERPPVGKSLELSAVSTTKADSHFVLICWPIMMKNEQGNHREGVRGTRGNAEHLLSEVWALGWSLDGHKYPLLSNRNSSCSTDGVGYLVPFGV